MFDFFEPIQYTKYCAHELPYQWCPEVVVDLLGKRGYSLIVHAWLCESAL